jgi:hypothetical protein
MEAILNQLQARFPELRFCEGDIFVWSPETQEVIYNPKGDERTSSWSLLHETSHALLCHVTYGTDFELLRLEIAAWEKAKEIAKHFEVKINEDYIQDCLDSYRDWIYARSICPNCSTKSVQQNDLRHYRCFNCHEVWQVTPSRFCRAYRATKRASLESLPHFDALIRI